MKVIYIMGHGRSGSTILHSVLAQIPGFFGVGELRMIWQPGVVEYRQCGCGALLRECEMWSRVLAAEPGLLESARTPISSVVRDRYLPILWSPLRSVFLGAFTKENSERVRQFYQAIYSATGSSVIVDSSKSVAYAAFLNQVSDITPYFIHIVRDPRGVEYSLARRKDIHVRGFARHNSIGGALGWDTLNLSAEAFGRRVPSRYLRIRYEDFVEDPAGILARILDWASEPAAAIPAIRAQTVHLGKVHSIAGNAKRFQYGDILLKLDERWKFNLPARERRLVALLTFPLLKRYGYQIAAS